MNTSPFKIIFISFLLNPFSSLIESTPLDAWNPWCVEFRAAYFRPTDEMVREIYADSWVDYQFEVSRLLFDTNVAVWSSVNWYRTSGHSICCGDIVVSRDKTSLRVVPISFGLQYYVPIPQIQNARFYFGAGATVAFVRISDDSEFVKQRLSKNGAFGGVLKSGIKYFFQNNLFLDFFADYVFQPVHFSNGNDDVENLDACLDGVKLGVGLGLNF